MSRHYLAVVSAGATAGDTEAQQLLFSLKHQSNQRRRIACARAAQRRQQRGVGAVLCTDVGIVKAQRTDVPQCATSATSATAAFLYIIARSGDLFHFHSKFILKSRRRPVDIRI